MYIFCISWGVGVLLARTDLTTWNPVCNVWKLYFTFSSRKNICLKEISGAENNFKCFHLSNLNLNTVWSKILFHFYLKFDQFFPKSYWVKVGITFSIKFRNNSLFYIWLKSNACRFRLGREGMARTQHWIWLFTIFRFLLSVNIYLIFQLWLILNNCACSG